MKKGILLLLALSALSAQELFDTFELDGKNRFVAESTYEFDVDDSKGPERILNLQVTGDIQIGGEATHTVTIVEKIIIKSASKMKAKSVYKDYKAKVSMIPPAQIEVISGKRSSPIRTRFEYRITLPEAFNISVQTAGGDIDLKYLSGELQASTSGGDVTATSISGKFTGRTSGGDITLENIEGVSVVKTSGGDIEIERCDGKTSATTSGGDIEVSDCNGNLEVYTSGGDLELTDITGSRIQGRTSGGDIEVDDVEGNLVVSTSGGGIDIRKARGSVEAKTSSGDIDLESIYGETDVSTSNGDITGDRIHGALSARTSNGDIRITKVWDREIKNHDLLLKTSRGIIQLELPPNFPAAIEAIVEDEASTRVIDSEFPIRIYIRGDEVRGEGIINGGTYDVNLRTSSNSIIIEKD
jgi:hypothetical protein